MKKSKKIEEFEKIRKNSKNSKKILEYGKIENRNDICRDTVDPLQKKALKHPENAFKKRGRDLPQKTCLSKSLDKSHQTPKLEKNDSCTAPEHVSK